MLRDRGVRSPFRCRLSDFVRRVPIPGERRCYLTARHQTG